MLQLSQNSKRQQAYQDLLNLASLQQLTLQQLALTGAKLMRQAKLHPHFFGNNKLLANALYLACYSLDLPYYKATIDQQQLLTSKQTAKIIALFETRITTRLPVEYLTNEAYYLGNKFYVNQDVLTPRSVMNTRFPEFLQQICWENYRVLDLCTGSGCIGITLALLHPNIMVDLVDISPKALAVAKLNIKNYNLEQRVSTIQSDLFNNIQHKYDLIITNPPYVTTKEYRSCPAEFKNEPQMALLAGSDGMQLVSRILANAKAYLNPNGVLIAEVGCTVAKTIKKRYSSLPLQWYNYKSRVERTSLFDQIVNYLGIADCIFVCLASDLLD